VEHIDASVDEPIETCFICGEELDEVAGCPCTYGEEEEEEGGGC
jgi:hypothetical protein